MQNVVPGGGLPSPGVAGIAQLVERDLAKVEVAGSNPAVRSIRKRFGGTPQPLGGASTSGDMEDSGALPNGCTRRI